MADIFATPGVHAEKFDQVAGGVIPYVTLTTPATAIPTTDSLGGTREHRAEGIARHSVSSASARVSLPTLGTSRELYVMGTNRLFFVTGDNTVTAAAGTSHPLAADERFYFRVPSGHTHIAFIRDSLDGFISIVPVA